MKFGRNCLSVHKNKLKSGSNFCIVHWIKPTVDLGKDLDESNSYMIFGSKWVINKLESPQEKKLPSGSYSGGNLGYPLSDKTHT